MSDVVIFLGPRQVTPVLRAPRCVGRAERQEGRRVGGVERPVRCAYEAHRGRLRRRRRCDARSPRGSCRDAHSGQTRRRTDLIESPLEQGFVQATGL